MSLKLCSTRDAWYKPKQKQQKKCDGVGDYPLKPQNGAIPFSSLWAKVDKRFDIPLMGLALSTVVDAVLGCIVSRYSEDGMNMF